jgi:hypothetical protein
LSTVATSSTALGAFLPWLPNGRPIPLGEDLHLISNKIQDGLKLDVRLVVEGAATFVGREHP